MRTAPFLKSVFSFLLFFILIPSGFVKFEFQQFRLVLDPGHGGVCKRPQNKYGDRFDTISGRYLYSFREGASYGPYHEHLLMYEIAEKVFRHLKNLSQDGNFSEFAEILKKYSDPPFKKIYITTMMSRGNSLTKKEAVELDDPNRGYRLFDSYDEKGGLIKGRLSKINDFRPHLVVSLHCATNGPGEYKGMSAVIVPPISFMKKGLEYLKNERKDKSFFYKSGFRDWFCESAKRTPFGWFLSDTSMYYTAFPLKKNENPDKDAFRGYRYNMVSWAYKDRKYWEMRAKYHRKNTNYSSDYNNFRPYGKFWDRERSIYETFRRGGGPEGFGGDNLYASNELIRYMMYSLKKNRVFYRDSKPGRPYTSVWILPMHVNAVNAFIELGYLARRRDRYHLVKKQNELAEGIAVGIYSLFTGLELRKAGMDEPPLGKRIDLEKYRTDDEESYFDKVIN